MINKYNYIQIFGLILDSEFHTITDFKRTFRTYGQLLDFLQSCNNDDVFYFIDHVKFVRGEL